MNKGLLTYLPKASNEKHQKWFYQEEVPVISYDSAVSYPKISIITPSYNQGHFIEDTIRSILLQNYPNIEYIVMDGGSTDSTVSVLKKYDKWIDYWVSEPDKGQSDAINRGFEKATGDILLWLNSDDYYLPGALLNIVNAFNGQYHQIVFGNCNMVTEKGDILERSDVRNKHKHLDITLRDYIIQPSSAWGRSVWEEVGKLKTKAHYSFDWEWYIRAKLANIPLTPFDDIVSEYRKHDAHKTGTGGRDRTKELTNVYRTYHTDKVAAAYQKIKDNVFHFYIVKILNRLNSTYLHRINQRLFFNTIDFKTYINISGM